MESIGVAIHKVNSQACIITEDGEVLERAIRTEVDRFEEFLGGRARARILIEASTESEWVARCLESLGHEVVVADPNCAAMDATRSRRMKTDRRDARTLAEACQLGAYRPAHRLSEAQRHIRAELMVRESRVRARSRYVSVIRALVRRDGLRVRSGGSETFVDRLAEIDLPEPLSCEIAPIIALMEPLLDQIQVCDARVREHATNDDELRREAAKGSDHKSGRLAWTVASHRVGLVHSALEEAGDRGTADLGRTDRQATGQEQSRRRPSPQVGWHSFRHVARRY